jgi:hypothetical protein
MSGFLRSLAARGAGLGHPTQPRAMSAAVELGVPPSDLAAREPPGEEAAVLTFPAERPEVAAPPVLDQPRKLASAAPAAGEHAAGGQDGHSVAVSPPSPEPAAPADPAPLREPVEIDDASPSAAAATPAASPAAAARPGAPRSHAPVEAASPPAPVPAESAGADGVALPPEAPRAAAAVPTSHAKVSAPRRAPVVHATGESLAAPVRSPSPARATTGTTASSTRAAPAREPSIEVRIGRLEVRAPHPPETPPSALPVPERGFDDLALARRGLERRWY